jgi:tetratricopeptide (TPR) repeat protein
MGAVRGFTVVLASWGWVQAVAVVSFAANSVGTAPATQAPPYAGSQSCRECHTAFYQLWSTSHHGLAMQPYSLGFARTNLTAQASFLQIGRSSYRAEIGGTNGFVLEQGTDPKVERRYSIEHVLGGKNVFYFLTPLEGGRLQTLPVAYDVRKKQWFDTALSAMRHFPGQQVGDVPLHWKEWPYTFNTACYNCHVSQLSKNYDPATDRYQTTWKEAGINCETCHGPCDDHVRAMRALPPGKEPTDYRLIRTKTFTSRQHNDACASCHSKASPITEGYRTPERFFDHFDLVTLENPDYYPDGRDLGENYTQTSWLLNPCSRKGPLHCVTCHTSSGRYRFAKTEEADKACLPCHSAKVKDREGHTHHKGNGPGSHCVDCHMPTTEFARMRRTDHSMLPPTPAATLKFKSPNACNECHKDKDAAWADRLVREWHRKDYQEPVLRRAALIDAARKADWTRLDDMLAYVSSSDRNEVFVASLLRLMRNAYDRRLWPALAKAAEDRSPLVRAAAAEALGGVGTAEALQTLATLTSDESRLVRVRAASSLAERPELQSRGASADPIKKATDEFLAALLARPDSWDAHYNLGNYHLAHGDTARALQEYDSALKKEPHAVLALVNASIAHARQGQTAEAEAKLQSALQVETNNAAAHFNLGLLKAEQDDLPAAAQHLRTALRLDPQLAAAAYNLGVLTAREKPEEALTWCRRAAELRPDEPKYAYTLAFFEREHGLLKDAARTLEALIERHPGYFDAYLLLGEVREADKNPRAAERAYRLLLSQEAVPQNQRQAAQVRLRFLATGSEASQ